jgi:hypothetical protein
VSANSACVADFRKYSDTVAISSAIFHLFEENPPLGRFVGIEHRLVGSSSEELLTPDITVVYDNDSKGLLFELKYSLPTDVRSVKDELLKLAKYSRARDGWGVRGPIQPIDFILVCHSGDVKRTVDAVREVFAETNNSFFSPDNFSVWYWTLSATRGDERKEEMRLLRASGATRNLPLQRMIDLAGGISMTEDVLMSLRFTNVFVRQKPPVQYTITLLVQNVFSALPPVHRAWERRKYDVSLDLIYEKANALFPPWWETDVQTVQVKRGWIKEALDTLVKIKLIEKAQPTDSYSIPIPTITTRRTTLIDLVCTKLSNLLTRGRRGRSRLPKRVRKRKAAGYRSITEFLGNRGQA